jgi:hypothetical protein
MKKHIIKGMGKAKADGFAPGDMLINKFNGGSSHRSYNHQVQKVSVIRRYYY